MFGGPENHDFIESMVNLTGIKYSADINGGDPNCVTMAPHVMSLLKGGGLFWMLMILVEQSMNWHDKDHRSSSIEAYYTPVEDRRAGLSFLIRHQVL